jgi:curli biogenesis system outer membrane secretion channel CsgG
MTNKTQPTIRTRLAVCVISVLVAPTYAAVPGSTASATGDVPTCSRKLGTVTVAEPDVRWWEPLGLGSPEALIKVFVSRSQCFSLVDRGKGMAVVMAERELAAAGELQGDSNLGKGQVKAADFVLVPDLISKNRSAGGSSVGGLIGGMVGGTIGGLLGGISVNSKTADVTLALTEVRSSEMVALTEGHAKKTNLGWGAGTAFFAGGLGGLGASGYTDTEIGKVITLAYLDAFGKLVSQLQEEMQTTEQAGSP